MSQQYYVECPAVIHECRLIRSVFRIGLRPVRSGSVWGGCVLLNTVHA